VSATEVELDIGGMTCASCASRVERKLNRMPGVTASVNYATEKATVHAPDGTTASDLIATVEATGYTAELPAPAGVVTGEDHRQASEDEASLLRRRVIVSACWQLSVGRCMRCSSARPECRACT
jgi:Cu+-exporting ATPase